MRFVRRVVAHRVLQSGCVSVCWLCARADAPQCVCDCVFSTPRFIRTTSAQSCSRRCKQRARDSYTHTHVHVHSSQNSLRFGLIIVLIAGASVLNPIRIRFSRGCDDNVTQAFSESADTGDHNYPGCENPQCVCTLRVTAFGLGVKHRTAVGRSHDGVRCVACADEEVHASTHRHQSD